MWQLARRPRWIAALFLSLAIAGAFAALGQWQLSRSVEQATVVERDTETVVPLDSIAEPNSTATTIAAGQKVTVSGSFVPGDTVILSGRSNQGVSGYWLMAHLRESSDAAGANLAVAIGWSADEAGAASAARQLDGDTAEHTFAGRYLTTEPPTEDDYEAGEQNSASVAALINQWAEPVSGVYGGYLVLDNALVGLDTIDSPVPTTDITLNWLNIFYAVEWVVFAGFAIFLWFRLVKDAFEREEEERADEAAAAGASAERTAAAHVN